MLRRLAPYTRAEQGTQGSFMDGSIKKNTLRQQFFAKHAAHWGEQYSLEKQQRIGAMVQQLPLSVGMTVIDVGCGQGVLLPHLRAVVGATGRLVAVDIVQEMLQHVPSADAHAWPLLAQTEQLPLLSGWADAVICFSAFPHIQDKHAAATEWHRILKPGGCAYILHIDGRERLNCLHDAHAAVKGDHLPCLHGMQKLFAAAGFTRTEGHEDSSHYYFMAAKENICV